jgi:hypothetical protein
VQRGCELLAVLPDMPNRTSTVRLYGQVPGEATHASITKPEITLGWKGLHLRAGEIVLISHTRGHKVYINTGAPRSTDQSRSPPRLVPAQRSAP